MVPARAAGVSVQWKWNNLSAHTRRPPHGATHRIADAHRSAAAHAHTGGTTRADSSLPPAHARDRPSHE
eukprot:2462669-Prymnesium_polylepis.1